MENENKMAFWKKLKFSIFDFEKYQVLATERISRTISYILILIFIFALVVSSIYTYKFYLGASSVRQYVDDNIESITFENYKLNIITKNKEETTRIENENIGIKIIINTKEDEEKTKDIIDEFSYEERGILILRDKVFVKNPIMNRPYGYDYQTIATSYNINKVEKQDILNLLSGDGMKTLITIIFTILLIYLFLMAYLPSTLIDILILSGFAFIVSRIAKIRLKYSVVYNISAYSLTLSIILNMIYILLRELIGFNIKYFDIMYISVATIYIIAAILLIRSNAIKQHMELTKILEEQEKVRQELKWREKERQKEKDEDDGKAKENKNRKKKEKEGIEEEPEGNNA